jgi:ABC-type uncharacterized transport system auxiliary subunit
VGADVRAHALLFPLALCAWLAGCAQAPAPPDRFYRLLPTAPARLAQPALPGTLVVGRFVADGLLGQRALVYAEASNPGALLQYHYHFWADPPTALLQAVTVDALRAAGVARAVVTPDLGVDADYVLVGRVRRLEHLLGDAPAVVVSLEMSVVGAGGAEPLLIGDYEVSLPAAGPGVDAAVSAMGDAVSQILAEFVAALPRR